MSDPQNTSFKNSTNEVTPKIAGGGSGVIIIILAKAFGESPLLSEILIYASPFFAIIMSVFYKHLLGILDNWWTERSLKKYCNEAIKKIDEKLLDPNLNNEDKIELGQLRKEIDRKLLTTLMNKIESVNIKTERSSFFKKLKEES